jgi:hypothetical protein
MENMDNFRERFEALEQQTEQLKHQTQTLEAHTHTVERRLRWWRGIACGVVMLSLLSLALPSGKAADAPGRGMAERMATLEKKLAAMDFDDAANEVVISGANLRIVNGLGSTETTNGLGNLIVGYNELRQEEIPQCRGATTQVCTDTRTGSHNVIVGSQHNFSSFGGLVVGELNEISGQFAAVSGGSNNLASGLVSSVSGGRFNTASGRSFATGCALGPFGPDCAFSSVSGGIGNTASGAFSSVSGGNSNRASGQFAAVSGGSNNLASGFVSSVSGGNLNTARGDSSSVSGGDSNTASGLVSSVSGGENNTASGGFSAVSGGTNRSTPAQFNWAAGALFSDQ